jgi:hypothetical protein
MLLIPIKACVLVQGSVLSKVAGMKTSLSTPKGQAVPCAPRADTLPWGPLAAPLALQASTLLPLGHKTRPRVRTAPLQTTALLDLLPQFPAQLVHTALKALGLRCSALLISTLLRARQAFYTAASAIQATSPTKTWAPEKLHAAHAQRAIPHTLVTNSAQLAQRESTPMQWVAFASHAHRGAMGTQPK